MLVQGLLRQMGLPPMKSPPAWLLCFPSSILGGQSDERHFGTTLLTTEILKRNDVSFPSLHYPVLVVSPIRYPAGTTMEVGQISTASSTASPGVRGWGLSWVW